MPWTTTNSERAEFGTTCDVCGRTASPKVTVIFAMEARVPGGAAPAICVGCLINVAIRIGKAQLAETAAIEGAPQ